MNKKQLIERMIEHTGSPKSEAEKHLQAFTAAISGALEAGEEVQIPGFGQSVGRIAGAPTSAQEVFFGSEGGKTRFDHPSYGEIDHEEAEDQSG